ncbi:hypothetical protein [Streptomyces sp. GbtcB6]|uniref:hypothetical protein n=1 Tax=Streptomyces sp. GbtcB6 TaxID=2824751 RepID=UPI001C2F18CD|nr:hypothetical protein [Streptomyces sp. GbtcB6]
MTTDPQYHVPRPLTAAEAAEEAARLIKEAYQPQPEPQPVPTSYREPGYSYSPVPAIGTTPAVPQPDSRIAPQWAVGVAVASIGVGAGTLGLGCGAWLFFQGLSSATLMGALTVTGPVAGLGFVVTAIGSVIAKVKAGSTTHVYQGQVIQRTEIKATASGFLTSSKAGRK